MYFNETVKPLKFGQQMLELARSLRILLYHAGRFKKVREQT